MTGPLGEPVEAAWRLGEDGIALIEAAQACGLTLAGGPEQNDPLRATSRGVGELVAAAVAAGAERIIVFVGGVASTDGGAGATEAVPHPLVVPLDVACDVEARFLEAADVFAPQKGATPAQVADFARAAREARRPGPARLGRGGWARRRTRGDRRAPRSRLRTRLGSARPRCAAHGRGSRGHRRGPGRRNLHHGQGRRPRPRACAGGRSRGARRRRRRRARQPHRRGLARRELRSRARTRGAGGVPRRTRRRRSWRPAETDPKLLAGTCRSQSPTHRTSATAQGWTGCGRSRSAPSSCTTRASTGLPGGFLGVDLFFVLSGYLITSLLLVEWEARTPDRPAPFLAAACAAALPRFVVVVLLSLALAAIFARQHLGHTRSDVLGSLFYFANWHEIVANRSYFNLMGNPSLLQHTWSLAVEEQFYIVWPLILVPCLVLVGRKRLPMLVIAGIAASATLMWMLYNPNGDPSRVYYGTDTRAFLLLMGILVALLWPWIMRMRRAVPLLELFGIAALGLHGAPLPTDAGLRARRCTAAAISPRVLLRRARRRGRPSADRHRGGARRRAAALGRRAQLRNLSLALADHRADRGRERAAERGRRRCGGSARPRGRRALVQVRRAADPDGEPAAQARPASAPVPARGRRRWSAGPCGGLRDPVRDPVLAEPGIRLRQPAKGEGIHAPPTPDDERRHHDLPADRAAYKRLPALPRAGSWRSATR